MENKSITPEGLTDESPMPFGKHEGSEMVNVPDSYLLNFMWVENKHAYKKDKFSLSSDVIKVMDYIADCFDEKKL